MANASKTIELAVRRAPTVDPKTAQSQLVDRVKNALKEVGDNDLVASGLIQVEPRRGFPSDQVIVILITFFADIALESYIEMIRREGEKLGQATVTERGEASPDHEEKTTSDD